MMPLEVVTMGTGVYWWVTVDRHRIASINKDPGKLGLYHLKDHDGDLIGSSRSMEGITALARRVFDEGVPI